MRDGGLNAMSRSAGSLITLLMLGASVVFVLYALAQPVAEDRARIADSMGPDSTNTTWTRPLAIPTAPPIPPPSRPATIKVPSPDAIRSGHACLPLSFLLSNRSVPTNNEWGYAREVDCPVMGHKR
jgi:hypothetical protein